MVFLRSHDVNDRLGLQPGHCGSFISNSINTQPNSILFIILKIKEIKKKTPGYYIFTCLSFFKEVSYK